MIGPFLNVASISLRGSKVLKQVALAHKREVGQSTKSNTRMTRIEKNHLCSIKHVSVINTILASILLSNINGDLWVKPGAATPTRKLDKLCSPFTKHLAFEETFDLQSNLGLARMSLSDLTVSAWCN